MLVVPLLSFPESSLDMLLLLTTTTTINAATNNATNMATKLVIDHNVRFLDAISIIYYATINL